MLTPLHDPDDETLLVWWRAAHDPLLLGAIEALRQHAQDIVSLNRPVCLGSGKCCRFSSHGHVLLVTGLEAAIVLSQTSTPTLHSATSARERGECAFLEEGLCSIHSARPLGCHAYFCREGSGDWQARLAEGMHGAVRRLHEEHAIEYLCAEWTWFVEVYARASQRGFLSLQPAP